MKANKSGGKESGERLAKVHVTKGGDRILGATIVARHGGEMIGEIGVSMAAGLGLGKLASVIHPYPTQAESIRGLGDSYHRTRLTPGLTSGSAGGWRGPDDRSGSGRAGQRPGG